MVGDEVVIEKHNLLSDSIVETISKTISMTIPEQKILDDFITAARNLDYTLYIRAQTHRIITLLDPSIVHGKLSVAPVHSKELLPAIDRRNIGASSVSIAFSDLFLVARRVRQIGRSTSQSSNNYDSRSFPSDARIPSWFNNNSISSYEIINTTAKHLVLNDSLV